ncbi:MAG: DUF6492 family protein [Isosphaeraceae bacterium]
MSYAIVTPSYGPDFERCRLLCESVERFVGGDYRHYLVVDDRDRPLFRKLEGPRTEVLTVEEVMPWWLRRLPCARRWWFSFKTPPVRNWILQQLVKLSVGEFIDADNYVFIDSDVAVVRPFEVEALSPGGRLRLFRVEGVARKMPHINWHRTSARLLGLPMTDYFGATYIGNLITWRRENLRALYRRIEEVHGRPWLETVARQWHLSEYILYGIFVEHVLKGDSGQVFTDLPLAHISWDYTLNSDAEIAQFFSEVKPYHVAVMVSSKQRVDVGRYLEHLPKLHACPRAASKCDAAAAAAARP